MTERPPTILVVEDNPITRKMFRVALQGAGYDVEEAGDGHEALEVARHRPLALVLQDLRLPDMSGFELAERLQALPYAAEAPIIAVSGMLSVAEESGIAAARFHDFLAKPVEPSRLLEVVAAYLPRTGVFPERPGAGWRVLVVDDEPIQRKLAAVRLTDCGYTVETAPDGEAALAQARKAPPDAIVSDILMPKLDGFGLCRAVRQDPRLAHIPVVLASSTYSDQEDRDLATSFGADACVTRTPDMAGILEALAAARSAERVQRQAVLTPLLTTTHMNRVVHHLERQVAMSAALARRNVGLAAQLAALEGLASVLAHTLDPDQATREILAHCLEAGGVSQGAIYLRRPGGAMVLRAAIGVSGVPGAEAEFFGPASLLEQLVAAHPALALPSPSAPEPAGREILARSGCAGLVIARIPGDAQPMGALVMGSGDAALNTEEWLTFARVVGNQIGYAFAITQLQEQVRQAQKMEAVGRLAGGVAHDFNNLLTVIMSYADLAAEELPEGSSLRQDLAQIRKAGSQAASLTRQLLAFSRQQLLEPVVLSLNDLLEDVRDMLQRVIGEDVVLIVNLAQQLGNVQADPGQLQQVVMNLAVNARDAMPTGGTLRIETALSCAGRARRRARRWRRASTCCCR